MTISNFGRLPTIENPLIRAKQIAETKPDSGIKTADDVLASLRKMMPGWTITTSTADWSEGFRNIQIDREILQKMANDPVEMEKYTALILDLEDAVPELEKWGRKNPGQSVEIGVSLDAQGNTTAIAVVKTLLGVEKSTAFNLPKDKSFWAETIRQRLEALNQGQVEDANGAKSWIA